MFDANEMLQEVDSSGKSSRRSSSTSSNESEKIVFNQSDHGSPERPRKKSSRGGGSDGGGGGGGGGGPGGSPHPRGLEALYGDSGDGADPYDLSWTVTDETTIYKNRDLALIEVPDLPTTATAKRGWDATTSINISSIDTSPNDTLMRWILVAMNPKGGTREVCTQLHSNSQGLHRLDRHLGKLMSRPANLTNKTFGLQFAAYVEYCHRQGTAPRGRVMVAMVALRFRLDRCRGNVLNQVHLLSIPLMSFKHSDVRTFVEKVRLCMANIAPNEVQDKKLLFQWLFEKFRGWRDISAKIEKIKESSEHSSKRSWAYLWTVINNQLTYHHEDENYQSIAQGISGQVIGGQSPPARTRRTRRRRGRRRTRSTAMPRPAPHPAP